MKRRNLMLSFPLLWIWFWTPQVTGECFTKLNNTRSNTGDRLSGISSEPDCVNYCNASNQCTGVTWNSNKSVCWETILRDPTRDVKGCFLYTKVKNCTETETSTASSTGNTDANAVSGTWRGTMNAWSDKEGYFIYENGNKRNSLVIKQSRIYCAVQCVQDIQCNGFDYNSTDLSCHFKTDDFHYRRIG